MAKKPTNEETTQQEVTVEPSLGQKLAQTDGLTLSLGLFGAAYGGYLLSRTYMRRVLLHPLLVFGVGALVGAYTYKHRKRLVQTANDLLESGSDYVLEQKERLSDLIAEAKSGDEAEQ